MIRVIIVDDHPVVRRGLKQIIEEETDMEVAGEAKKSGECFSLVRQTVCTLVLLDITLPDRNGFDVLKQLKYEHPKIPVLILSVTPGRPVRFAIHQGRRCRIPDEGGSAGRTGCGHQKSPCRGQVCQCLSHRETGFPSGNIGQTAARKSLGPRISDPVPDRRGEIFESYRGRTLH